MFENRSFGRSRRGKVSPGLLIALAVIALGVAGFMIYWSTSSTSGGGYKSPVSYLHCFECRQTYEIKAEEAKLPVQGSRIECPHCKKYAAIWVASKDAPVPEESAPPPPPRNVLEP